MLLYVAAFTVFGLKVLTVTLFLITMLFFVIFCIAAIVAAGSSSGPISDAEAVAASSPTDSPSD